MNVTIRTMRPDEFLAIHKLNSRWMGIPLENQADAILALQFRVIIENFHNSCFVAECDGQPAGLILGFAAQANDTSCYLHALAVAPGYRRCGLGRALTNTFCDYMARRGRKKVSLVTWPENPQSRAFYEKNGFAATVVGKPIDIHGIQASRDYYGKDRHMVLYVKELP